MRDHLARIVHGGAMSTLLALSMLLAACQDQGASASSAAETPAVPAAVPVDPPVSGYAASLKAPLAAYDLSSKQAASLWTAMRLLRISCMQKKGYTEYVGQDMEPVDEAEASSNDAFKQPAGPWGYLGAETAAQRGFLNSVIDNKKLTKVDLPETTLTASRACYDDASAKLTRPTAGADLVRQLTQAASINTERDSRVVAARETWRGCMAKEGFQTAHPQELVEKQWRARPDDPPAGDEIQAARTDEKCTRSSGLARIYFPVEWAYQRALIDQNLQVLTEYQKQVQARLAEAARIAATGASS
ncbi:hypothetical protein HH310_36700 [Actinoplanes sp. TBRC 11911]|uniref:hypothetical protein n=1 Tax=Actinoplanes sp. TBRC 11911 TaxID=2729386 RepID=UPI00145D9AD4|nr:hypothetical protein [Actinoplanes sp. TBRC 11911]NMO56701.1 hypothetical protein [Actinoplanes sp. TBRC 11911]